MSRRVSLPGADELFRNTAKKQQSTGQSADPTSADGADESGKASGRVKHDEKMTVYLTAAELITVEKARIELRGELGKTVDRGRLVRAALALALEDLEKRGTDSDIASRLRES